MEWFQFPDVINEVLFHFFSEDFKMNRRIQVETAIRRLFDGVDLQEVESHEVKVAKQLIDYGIFSLDKNGVMKYVPDPSLQKSP